MRQNDSLILKITGAVFLICLITASIMYFQPQKQPLKWNNFDKALKDAKTTGKPILLSFYSRWNRDCKFVNDNFFSDDSVKKLMNERFILAQISLDDTENKKIAKDRFNIHNIPTLIILNTKEREMRRLSHFGQIEFIRNWLADSSFQYMSTWSDYEEAKVEAEKYKKILFVYCSLSSDDNLNAGNLFANNRIRLLIAQDYIPTLLSYVNLNDKQLIDKIQNDVSTAPNLNPTSAQGIPMLNPNGESDLIALYYEGKILGIINMNMSMFYEPKKLTEILDKVSGGKAQGLIK